jgi:hypothetical protein
MQVKSTLTLLQATKRMAMGFAAMLGLALAAFAGGQAVDNASAFETALEAGDINTVSAMLDGGMDVNFRFNKDSKQAQRDGESFAYTWIAIDESTMDGAFPLFIAAEYGRLDVVRQLLGRGANVNLRTNYGATALYIAAQEGHGDIVTELLARGADVSVHTDNGWTALMAASYKGWDSVARALIKGGANPNDHGSVLTMPGSNADPQDRGFKRVEVTPLYLACLAKKDKVVSALLASGANLNMVMSNGETALDAANGMKDEDVAEVLTKAGAKPAAQIPFAAQVSTGPAAWSAISPPTGAARSNSEAESKPASPLTVNPAQPPGSQEPAASPPSPRRCIALQELGSHVVRNMLLTGGAAGLISKDEYKVVAVIGYPARIGQKFHANDLPRIQGNGTKVVLLDKHFTQYDLRKACP